MNLRIGDEAPNFTANTTVGEISFHQWHGNNRTVNITHPSDNTPKSTTNKTKISDYQEAIQEDTALILRVHPSNYKILGFTQRPTLEELTELAHRTGCLLYTSDAADE